MCQVRIVSSILMAVAAATLVAGFPAALTPQVTAQTAQPDVPHPAECITEPRPASSLLALMGDAPAMGDHGADGMALVAPPLPGEPADADTLAGVTATVREILACVNAGEYLRALALYSDDLVRRVFAQDGGLPFGDATAETVAATPGAGTAALPVRLALVDIRDVRVLPDARSSAVVVVGFAAGRDVRAEPPVLIVFVKRHERWLEDEVINLHDSGLSPTTGPGTPAP